MQLHQIIWNLIKATTLQLRYLSCFACNATEECKHFSLKRPFFDTIKHRISENTNVNIKKFSKSSDEIKVGAWVAVIYDSWYSGLVEKVNDNDKLEINFMNRSGKILPDK